MAYHIALIDENRNQRVIWEIPDAVILGNGLESADGLTPYLTHCFRLASSPEEINDCSRKVVARPHQLHRLNVRELRAQSSGPTSNDKSELNRLRALDEQSKQKEKAYQKALRDLRIEKERLAEQLREANAKLTQERLAARNAKEAYEAQVTAAEEARNAAKKEVESIRKRLAEHNSATMRAKEETRKYREEAEKYEELWRQQGGGGDGLLTADRTMK